MSPAHAEIEFVWVRDEAVTVQGRVLGDAAPESPARIVARRERDGSEIGFAATLTGRRFDGRLELPTLPPPPDGEEIDFWELFLDAGGPLRLAKRLDGVENKARAMTYGARRVRDRWIRPVFTDANELSLRSRPAVDHAAGARRQAPKAERAGPPGALDVRLHLLALKAARPLMRRRVRPAAGRTKVTILLTATYGMSGIVRSVLNLAEHLTIGYDVEILDVIRRHDKPFFTIPPGVKVTTLDDQRTGRAHGWRPWVRPLLVRFRGRLLHPGDKLARHTTLWTDLQLLRHLRRVRSGVLISSRPSFNVLGSEIARPGVAAVGQEHMHLRLHGPPLRAAIRRHYGNLDAMAVLSEADRDRYDEVLGGATPVVAIPNAVPRLGGPLSHATNPVAIAAGRLTRQKGFDRLIPVFAEIARQEPEWTLRICGNGPEGPRLRKLIVKHEASNHVLMLGRVADMARQMQEAAIYVMTSRFEGFPLVLIEAMSKGLPVVSFDCPTGPADIVDDGRTGFLVPNGDVEALREAVQELIRDEPKRRRFGAAAVERAREFSLERVGARWDELLAGLGHPPRP